ncbi:MAG TPA: hypothetical protein VGB99_05205 [Acidobacteriota bacterium]
METLAEWLRRNRISPERFGTERLGVSKSYVRRLLFPPGHSCHKRPNDAMKQRIAEATGGAVPPEVWYRDWSAAAE